MFKKWLLCGVCCTLLLTGCGKKEESESILEKETQLKEEQEKMEEPEKVEEPEEDLTGKGINTLTGLYISSEAANRRPVSVMVNNAPKALPQSGISQADIIYEVLAEGGITRLTAVFKEIEDVAKIGPVRSARDYFTYIALDNDAIYVHHGGSDGGYAAIKKRDIDNINGMYDQSAFWRDKQRMNQPGMLEHSSYTSGEKILSFWEEKGYRQEIKIEPMLHFYSQENEAIGSDAASNVKLNYSPTQMSEFRYDADFKLYERWQNDKPQIDELTGETVTTKNILIQYVDSRVIDKEGRLEIDLVGKGNGRLISDGFSKEITWEKSSYDSPTKWFDESGNELKLNTGKTWICVFPFSRNVIIE